MVIFLDGVVTLSEIGPIWTINQQAKSLQSLAPTLAVVGKFRSVRLNVTTPVASDAYDAEGPFDDHGRILVTSEALARVTRSA